MSKKVCHFFLQNKCKFGNECTFLHEKSEIKEEIKTNVNKYCKNYFTNSGCITPNCTKQTIKSKVKKFTSIKNQQTKLLVFFSK
jgi:hypothetical protein